MSNRLEHGNVIKRYINRTIIIIIKNTTNTRQGNKFYVQFKRTTLKSFSISRCGVTLWNSLDSTLTELKSVILFKKCFKRVLMKAYNEE